MTRFDAPARSPSVVGAVMRATGVLVANRFGIVLAALVPTVLTLFVSTWLLSAGESVPSALRQAFVASPVLVIVRPTASRSDVEAIGPKLTAMPDVANATLRPKEEALAALVATGIPGPTDGRNPLPDVWTVALRGDGPSFMTEAVSVRDAISALPLVDSVRFDEAWAGSLDRIASTWSRFGIRWLAGGVAAVALVLLSVYVLLGRALRAPEAGSGPVPTAALVLVCIGLIGTATLACYVGSLLMVEKMARIALPGMKLIAAVGRLSIGKTLVEAVVACGLLLAIGIALGHRSDRSGRST